MLECGGLCLFDKPSLDLTFKYGQEIVANGCFAVVKNHEETSVTRPEQSFAYDCFSEGNFAT